MHHGGAGTTAAAMRAGVPSLIMWLWLDQPVWAAGVQQLKIGVGQRFSEVTRNRWPPGLKSILTPDYLAQARNIAGQMITTARIRLCALPISWRVPLGGLDQRLRSHCP